MTVNVPMSTVDVRVDVHVTGVRVWSFRAWLMVQLIKLAAWVGPVSAHIEVEKV